jgi:transmembrane sensor
MLNTATRVTVKYDSDHREVRLVEGEADFNVVADRRRPFVVEADGRRFTATTGGGFRVRKLKDAPLDILVHQGRVELASPTARNGGPVILGTNTRLVLSDASPGRSLSVPHAVEPSVVTRDLAWRDGKIAFQGETLAQAAAAFGRYSNIRIVIEDSALAGEPVTGLFAANDPVGFGRAVAGVFGVAVEERDGTVILGAPSAA